MNLTLRAPFTQALGHHQMVIGTSGHLRQVRHCHDLSVAPQLLHQQADGFGHCAADASVNLVEYQSARAAQLAGGHGNGQSNARQLTARRYFGQRPWRAASVARHQKLGRLQAVTLRSVGWRVGRSKRNFKLTSGHAQLLHGQRDFGGQGGRRFFSLG